MSEEVKDIRELITETRGQSISTLLEKSYDIKNKSEDFNVSCANDQNVRFNDFAGITYMPDDCGRRDSLISPYALSQLCNKIGVPAQYIKKCCDVGMIDLAQTNVNTWLGDFNKDLFVREYDGHIRGVLSSKYSVCDSHEILESLYYNVDLKGYTVKGSFMNEERLHLRLINKNNPLSVNGEDLFPGICIDSSDVGRSILTCSFFIFKQVCTNGLVVSRAGGNLFRQRHIGIDADEFRKGLNESLSNISVLSENAEEFIERCRNQISPLGNFNVAHMKPEEIEKLVSSIKLNTKLSDEGSNKVINLMDVKYGHTRWGYINALTEVAQDYTLERRLELESYAGNLLVS